MKKKINIVMLPTEDTKSKVWRNNSTDNLFYFEKTPMVVIRNTYTPQHLYFLSPVGLTSKYFLQTAHRFFLRVPAFQGFLPGLKEV